MYRSKFQNNSSPLIIHWGHVFSDFILLLWKVRVVLYNDDYRAQQLHFEYADRCSFILFLFFFHIFLSNIFMNSKWPIRNLIDKIQKPCYDLDINNIESFVNYPFELQLLTFKQKITLIKHSFTGWRRKRELILILKMTLVTRIPLEI